MKAILLTAGLLAAVLLSGCAENGAHLTSTSWVASAAIAAVVSAVVTLIAGIITKNKEYKNDYYKKVIDKGLKAIEAIEALPKLFVNYYIDEDLDEYYHAFFFYRRTY